ncbi:hypothetical protein C6503_09460 [Candidatus Poribacteria bacterium]|nr:MAG: hypothetical protein C6503_09460 [Candidatus Poribacteria bacterium]
MSDLRGVMEVIMAYPVHIMTFVGCVLLFFLVLPRRKRRRNLLSTLTEQPSERKVLTQHEKSLLAGKIQDSRAENLKKSFTVRVSSRYMKYMVFASSGLIVVLILWGFSVIGLILLTVLFIGLGLTATMLSGRG